MLRYAEALGARLDFSVHLAPGEPEVDPTSLDRPRPALQPKLDPTVVQTLRHRLEGPSLQDHAGRVAELVDTLVAMRREQGLPETTVRLRMGRNTASLDRVEQGRGERKYGLVLRYAYAVGARVHVTVTTCEGTTSRETPWEDSTRLSEIQAALIATRKAQNLDHAHIAKARG